MRAERRTGSGVGIVGLGASLPPTVRGNDWFASAARGAPPPEGNFLPEVERSFRGAARYDGWASDPFRGAVERRVIGEDQESSDLEVEACAAAIASAGRGPSDVDLLIGYSQIPDFAGPGNHGRVARKLGLRPDLAAWTLDSGCASFLPHLTVAVREVEAGDHQLGLLYQSCAVSRILEPAAPVSPLIGDGAVAEAVGAVASGLGFVGRVQITRGELCDGLALQPSDGRRRWTAAGEAATGFVIGTPDPRAAVAMGAEGVPYAVEASRLLLDRCGYVGRDVDFFVCAQVFAWFGEACAEAIGIPTDRVVPPEEHFARFGHLLAASLPLNLYIAWATRRLQVGDLVLAYSPGVGFTQAASLFRWALPPPRTLPAALVRARPPGTALGS